MIYNVCNCKYHTIISVIRVLIFYVPFKEKCSVFLKKNIVCMKTIHYPSTIRSHLVTIVPMVPFTSKSTSKLRSAPHFRNSIWHKE